MLNSYPFYSMWQSIFKTLFLIPFLFSITVQGQDVADIAGSWSGYIDIDGRELKINLTFTFSDEMLDGTIDIPEQRAYTLPVEVVDSGEGTITFQFETGHGPAIFFGRRNPQDDQITGEFNQFGEVYPFILKRNEFGDRLFSDMPEKSIVIPITDEQIGGNLILREERSPLVILVSGSGSNNRDLNIGGFRVFRKLSSGLYEKGYSTFRYDDRGIGDSTGESDATLREMAADLVSVTEHLRSQYAENISGIILLGHNQGGLVASMAVNKITVNGVVLAATPFLRGDKIITGQIRKIAEARGISDQIVQQNLVFQKRVYDVVHTGAGWEDLENELSERLEAQIRELPIEHQNALGDMSAFIQSQVDRQLETAKSRWFKSWIETEPVELISELNVPVLALFGEKDTQVLPAENREVADSLASTTERSFQTHLIPQTNHLFQEATTGMPTEYGMLDHEFSNQFISTVDEFLESLQFTSRDNF